ncbi:MAG TPA: cardiolipin synthase [Nitrospirota bacterium]
MISAAVISVFIAGILLSCIFIIYERNSPTGTLAWLLAMIFFPFAGLLMYFIFGRHRVRMRIKLIRAIRESVGDLRQKLDLKGSFNEVIKGHPKYEDLMRLAYNFPGPPPTAGNSVVLQGSAKESYPDMLRTISEAKEHVHAMYYIIRPDESGRKLMDALVERAKAGVEVRLLYDDIGSWSMKLKFFRPLIEAGGTVREYRPVHFSRIRTFYANFRNHRKMLIVDGKTAFTGGINIGDEYLGRDKKIGNWRDTNIKVTGPAAAHLQLTFAEDWYYVTGELLTQAYVNPGRQTGGEIVQVVPSGPDRYREHISHIFFTAITSARKRLFIASPYFVPDESVLTALTAASLRGVDVRLLFPKNWDRRIIKYASRSYYREMLEAGCKIYEYGNGFMHAKTMSVDGDLGIVGTANMDIRSFRLNFEVCTVCYSAKVASDLEHQFMRDLEDAEEIRLKRFSKRPRPEVFLENIARLTSAVL